MLSHNFTYKSRITVSDLGHEQMLAKAKNGRYSIMIVIIVTFKSLVGRKSNKNGGKSSTLRVIKIMFVSEARED